MRHPRLSGPVRLGLAFSVLWAAWTTAVALYGPLEPRYHAWMNTKFVDPDAPLLSLFGRLDSCRLVLGAILPIACAWIVGTLGFWVRAGYAAKFPAPLLLPGRLADVLALVQVLAFDEYAHRSPGKLEQELQGPPRSADNWADVARSHLELFRFDPKAEHSVSLITRHVSNVAGNARAPLSNEYTRSLLSLAVELHDRQLKRERAWEALVPVAVALVGALVAFATQAAAR